MKKIIALMLVLLLMLTMFVACSKEDEKTEDPANTPSTSEPSGETGDDPAEEEELTWDNVEGVDDTKQHDGAGIELPIVPIQ